jgi:hypothetical protein
MASHDEGHPAGRRAAEEPVIASLRKLGIAEEAIERAVERGDPEGAIFDAILLPAIAERTVSAAEVEAAGGLSAADVAALVNAFGFSPPPTRRPHCSRRRKPKSYSRRVALRTSGHWTCGCVSPA